MQRHPFWSFWFTAGITLGLAWPSEALASPSDSALTLWLSGNYRERQGEQQSWTALLGLTVAFDRLHAPREVADIPPRVAEPPAPTQPPPEPPPSSTRESAPEIRRQLEAPAAAPQDWQLSAAFVQAAVRAALRAQRATEREARFDSLGARSRASAALPELRLGAGRSTDQTVRLTPTTDDPYRYTQAGGADLWLEARVSWQLDRLLFAREELSVERLRDAHYQAKWKRAQAVVDALFAWQKALLEARDPERTPQEQLLAQLRAAHQAALVDTLTGGWFSEKYALWQLPEPTADTQR
jgi:hypothetical protein